MIIKFGLPGQMQLKIIPAIRNFCMHQGGDVHYIGGSDILPAPFSPEEEAEYIRQLESGSSMEARSKLIEHNLRLVVYLSLIHI